MSPLGVFGEKSVQGWPWETCPSRQQELEQKKDYSRVEEYEKMMALKNEENISLKDTIQKLSGSVKKLELEIESCKAMLAQALADLDIKVAENKTLGEQIRDLIAA